MSFVIVLTSDKKVSVVNLSNHSEHHNDQFNKLKEVGTDYNKTFDTEQEAIDFMLENFPKSMIDEKYHKVTTFDGNYCFER